MRKMYSRSALTLHNSEEKDEPWTVIQESFEKALKGHPKSPILRIWNGVDVLSELWLSVLQNILAVKRNEKMVILEKGMET